MRRTVTLVAFLASGLLLPIGAPGAGAAGENPWSGTWRTSWSGGSGSSATMTLTQTGFSVRGSYNAAGGQIGGTVRGDVLKGTWTESRPPPNHTGPFTFTLSDDGRSFTGSWSYADGRAGGRWNGTCVKGPCLESPDEDVIAFDVVQGGLPDRHVADTVDTRTVVRGTAVRDTPMTTGYIALDEVAGRVVHEVDNTVKPDTRIEFRIVSGAYSRNDQFRTLALKLRVTSSSERGCAAGAEGLLGARQARKAALRRQEGLTLRVAGCPHLAWIWTRSKLSKGEVLAISIRER